MYNRGNGLQKNVVVAYNKVKKKNEIGRITGWILAGFPCGSAPT